MEFGTRWIPLRSLQRAPGKHDLGSLRTKSEVSRADLRGLRYPRHVRACVPPFCGLLGEP